jgi:hypothetical protein
MVQDLSDRSQVVTSGSRNVLLVASNRQGRSCVRLLGVLVGGDARPGASGSALLLVGKVNWGGLVGVGQRRLQDAARPEPPGGHDVDPPRRTR